MTCITLHLTDTMRFAIFPNLNKPNSIAIAIEIRDFLYEAKAFVVAEDEKAEALKVPPLSSVKPNEIDYLISLGGDGTILRILHRHPELTAPMVGINLGGLGFMADIPVQDIFLSLKDILEGRSSVQSRTVLEGRTIQGSSCFAVNEIAFHRAQNPSLIELSIKIGDYYLNTFSADGLIISTANGSTAYSLAAGGPILVPSLDAFVITPICPHTISNRPIVVGADKTIQVEYISEYAPIEVTYDGFPTHTVATGQSISINQSSRMFRMVSLDRHDFYSTLRTKLGWTGKLKAAG